jgi:hypothetical protein
MRNLELIAKIYDRCPDMASRHYTVDQLFDRCMDIRDMIGAERPEIARNALWKNRDNFWDGGYIKNETDCN